MPETLLVLDAAERRALLERVTRASWSPTERNGPVMIDIDAGIVAGLLQQIEWLRAGLQPFADFGRELKMKPNEAIWIETDDGLTAGHFLEAARIL